MRAGKQVNKLWFNVGGETPESIERTRQFGIDADRLNTEFQRRELGTGDILTLSNDEFIQSISDNEVMLEGDAENSERIAEEITNPEEGGTIGIEQDDNNPNSIIGGGGSLGAGWGGQSITLNPFDASNSPLTPTLYGGRGTQKRFPWLLVAGVLVAGGYYFIKK